ncbi:hypothetical protein SM11_chr0742 [Sinorhizobium meliloti SM11]|uniref:Uncharacterized protein n=1 Tax=Sinorhizobium meliloti (strain SM11) TaxID=707241 RepID=F7X0N4_SINMM|nr:hypothetical protein SM11_chr0742 [Sinorhizobium meliloti SM11]
MAARFQAQLPHFCPEADQPLTRSPVKEPMVRLGLS